jgi:hypothetical protein
MESEVAWQHKENGFTYTAPIDIDAASTFFIPQIFPTAFPVTATFARELSPNSTARMIWNRTNQLMFRSMQKYSYLSDVL